MTTPTLDEFAEYVETLPRYLPCWGGGILGLFPVLAWLNTHPVVVQREVVAQEGVQFGVMMTARAHHNQVGTAVAWANQYMLGPAGPAGTNVDDLPGLFDLAGRAYLMRNLLAEVRQGVRRFEADGNRIVMTFDGDRRLDALDRLLDLTDDIDDPPESRPWDPRLRPWFDAGGVDTPWHETPTWVRDEFRASAVSLIAGYPSYLPPELDVGGFTIGEATRALEELLARGCYMNACTLRGSTSGAVIVPLVDVGAFVADLAAATGVPEDHVAQVVALLTLDVRGQDEPPGPRRAPLANPSVSDLIDLMDEPPYPPTEITQMQWEVAPYGDYEIHFDVSMA